MLRATPSELSIYGIGSVTILTKRLDIYLESRVSSAMANNPQRGCLASDSDLPVCCFPPFFPIAVC